MIKTKTTSTLLIGALALSSLFSTTTFGQLDTVEVYDVDKAHSSVEFVARHLSISKVRGNFKTFDGDIVWYENSPEKSRIKGEVEVSSVYTGIAKRDKHIVGSDFFEAKKFPKFTLESTSIKKVDDDEYEVTAKLTIKDVTKEITFPLEIAGETEGPYGKKRKAFEAEFKINRFDYNIGWKNKLKNNSLMVGEKVKIELNIQGIAK